MVQYRCGKPIITLITVFFFLIYSQLVRRVIIPCVAVKGHNCVDIVAPPQKKNIGVFKAPLCFPNGKCIIWEIYWRYFVWVGPKKLSDLPLF